MKISMKMSPLRQVCWMMIARAWFLDDRRRAYLRSTGCRILPHPCSIIFGDFRQSHHRHSLLLAHNHAPACRRFLVMLPCMLLWRRSEWRAQQCLHVVRLSLWTMSCRRRMNGHRARVTRRFGGCARQIHLLTHTRTRTRALIPTPA